MGKLDGKVAIVTGAGQGLGRGISLAFVKEGAKVVIAERNPVTAKAVEKELQDLGAQALAIVCDVSNLKQIDSTVAATVKKFGTVDIMVNNAQAAGADLTLEDIDEKSWDLAFNTGPKAALFFCKAVFPYMKNRGGKIINLGSQVGISGKLNHSVGYGPAKEAMRGLTRRVAREWGKYKITCNVICPIAATPSLAAHQKLFPERIAASVQDRPVPRWGDPELDIGRTAVFLASADSDFITGQTIMVDGGNHMF